MDLRLLRYFVVAAEELHFERAAQRLVMAQPALSRQIRALENDLGAELFARDRSGTELTRAGERLLEDARPLLLSAERVQRRVADAASGTQRFTVAFLPGLTVTVAVRGLRQRHPDIDVRLLRTGWDDQTSCLHDGRADVSLVHLPVETVGLRARRLYTEPRVVVLPAGHRLAGKDSVSIAELADEHLPRYAAPEVQVPAPEVTGVERALELVAAEAGVCVLPQSMANFFAHAGITTTRIDDIAPAEVAVTWLAAGDAPIIDDFLSAAAGLAPPT